MFMPGKIAIRSIASSGDQFLYKFAHSFTIEKTYYFFSGK